MKREELKVKGAYVQKGITLIALVITIIVLLILAGVTINLIMGDNGIIQQALKAQRENKKAQYFEEINLEILQEQAERAVGAKEEALIVSLKKRIQEKSWTSEENVIMCKETENGFEQREMAEENNILLIETNDGYEIIVEVNNITQEAKIRDYFEKIGERLTVTLELDEGEKEEKEVRKNFKIKLQEPSYTKSGYKFVGWSKDKEGEGTRYLAESEIKVEQDITLYAIWELNVVTITLVSNYGTGTEKQIEIATEINTTSKLPTEPFTRNRHLLTKWNTKADGTGIDYETGAEITLSEDITLYAQWELTMAAIILDSNYGTQKYTVEAYATPGVTTSIPDFTFGRTGYVLAKWNTKADGTGIEYGKQASITVNEDITLYAQWEIKPTAAMSFKVNGVSGVKKITEGTTIAIGGTASGSGIQSVQLKIGSQTVYTEQANRATTYSKELGLSNLSNLTNLSFDNNDTVTLTVTTINNNTAETSLTNVQNLTVGNANALEKLAEKVNAGTTYAGETILQIADITVSNHIPIGYYDGGVDFSGTKFFEGIYNGNNKSITINSIKSSTVYKSAGVFGAVESGTIKNLNTKGSISSACSYIGGIVGCTLNTSIQNCNNNITITDIASYCHGGIAGYASNSEIKQCKNSSVIKGGNVVGGIVGQGEYTNILNCKNTEYIESKEFGAGGICASSSRNVEIEKCSNAGEIYAINGDVGGIIGIIGEQTETSNVYESNIKETYNSGYVHSKGANGYPNCGGILGRVVSNVSVNITDCYNIGSIASTAYTDGNYWHGVGGIAGSTNSNGQVIIQNCYNTGNISNTYNSSYAGQILGRDFNNKKTILNCFYLNTSSGVNANGGIARTATQLQGLATTLGSTYWAKSSLINNGYPYLKNNQP